MKKLYFLSAVFGLLFAFFVVDSPAQTARKSVSAKEATGTFRMKFTGEYEGTANEIRLLPLGKGKIKVAFDLVYPYIVSGELTANMGTAAGVAEIKGDVATYESTEFGECRITIKFVKPGTIEVEQDGSPPDCGFGHNVTAAGKYIRTSRKKPDFDEEEIQ